MPTVKKIQIEGPYTTTERNALTGVSTNTIIFNSATAQFEFWTGSAWQTVPSDSPTFANVTVTSNLIFSGSNNLGQIDGSFYFDTGLILEQQAADKASANDLDIFTSGGAGNTVEITGTTQINAKD